LCYVCYFTDAERRFSRQWLCTKGSTRHSGHRQQSYCDNTIITYNNRIIT
jgi:hypothetical protein